MPPNTKTEVVLTPVNIRLKQALLLLDIKDPATVTNLAIVGTITDDDLQYIRENMRDTLQELDLGRASFEENKIPKQAFSGCTALKSIFIPATVTVIQRDDNFGFTSGFNDCPAFFTVHPDNPVYKSVNGVLKRKIKNNMKVFISGSISTKLLSKGDIAYMEEITERNRTILIGDAHGVDRAVQQYLFEQNYRNVIVYFSGETIRNNIGNWQTKQIPNPENLTGRKRYQLKDKAMADDYDCGLMIWNGKSKGTEANINYMQQLDKYFLVLRGKGLYCYNMHNINNMIML